ncbi:protein pelota homolog isoform X2 [Oscarella lobularis]|uniref:protein pelota homolog isoform X2 n=1 Tax=Oscarella lobularis TaxID=121494 RepID=UPI003313AF37
MKLVHKDISDKNGSGSVTLIPDEAEDMWHIYNLIAVNDSLRSTTIRKVQTESATGSTASNRVRTTLTLAVENIEFDTAASKLRVKGRNIVENPHVKMGAYHTIDLDINKKFTLAKGCWDVVALDRLDMACDAARSADVAAVIMHEGLAHICLLTPSMTVVRMRVEMNIPRKRKGSCSQHDKTLLKFYDNVMQGILRHVSFDVAKCVLVASPGFVKDQFCEHMFAQAIRNDVKVLIENKAKFLLVHASSGHKHALKEVLVNPSVMAKLSDTKATAEVKALDAFYAMLQNEPDRAFYGIGHVEAADSHNGIEVLLISDELFRSTDLATRRRYVALVESVKESGGDVRVFSSLHVSGEQLGKLSGVAAILRFPLPDIADLVDDDDDDDDDSDAGADKEK